MPTNINKAQADKQRSSNSSVERAIKDYRLMRPLIDITDSQYSQDLISIAGSILSPSNTEPATFFLRNINQPQTYMRSIDSIETESSLHLMSVLRDLGDNSFAHNQKALAFFSNQACLNIYEAIKLNPNVSAGEKIKFKAAALDTLSWLKFKKMKNPIDGKEYETERFREKLLDDIIQLRENSTRYGIKDGEAFEYAVKFILEYYLYSTEKEDEHNNVRHARTREDMSFKSGHLSALNENHDLVLTLDGVTHRIQLKTGSGSDENSNDVYSLEITVIAETELKGNKITDLLRLIKEAYRGDPLASEKINALAEKYIGVIQNPNAKASRKILSFVTQK